MRFGSFPDLTAGAGCGVIRVMMKNVTRIQGLPQLLEAFVCNERPTLDSYMWEGIRETEDIHGTWCPYE